MALAPKILTEALWEKVSELSLELVDLFSLGFGVLAALVFFPGKHPTLKALQSSGESGNKK